MESMAKVFYRSVFDTRPLDIDGHTPMNNEYLRVNYIQF